MKKIFFAISLLVIFMFLVSCAPQMTDEELEVELAKLTPEQREQLIKDLQYEEKNDLSWKLAKKYSVSLKVAGAPKERIVNILSKNYLSNSGGCYGRICTMSCMDSDGGDIYTKGQTQGSQLDQKYGRLDYNMSDICEGEVVVYDNISSTVPDITNCEHCLLEHFCELQPPGASDVIQPAERSVPCPNGCSNGACLPSFIKPEAAKQVATRIN